MTLTDLEYFLAVAERENIGRAAEALGLSQPALTRAIRRLEKLAGQSLFVRHPRGVHLTPAGQSLLARAQRIRTEYGDAVQELHEMKAGQIGLVRLGYSPSADERVIAEACRSLLVERPAAWLVLSTAFMKPLLSQLADGKLDLVVGPIAATSQTDFAATLLYRDDLVCVADRSHPLHRAARVTLADLAAQSWLLPPGDLPARAELERRFTKAGLAPPAVRVQSDHITPSQFRLLRGTGIVALVQGDALRGLQRMGIEKLSVAGFNLVREISIARRSAAFVSPLSKRLEQLIGSAARERRTQPRAPK